MTGEEFTVFMEKTMLNLIVLQRGKASDYSSPDDAFAGVRRMAEEMELTEEKTLLVYMAKHWDAIRSYINRGDGRSNEKIEGRIHDMMVYLMLLEAKLKGL